MACACRPLGYENKPTDIDKPSTASGWMEHLESWFEKEGASGPLPEPVSGVFWMDGNPKELLLSLATSDFRPKQHRLIFRTYNAYSWASEKAMTLTGHRNTCCVYDLHFSSDAYDYAVIDAWNYGCFVFPRCCCLFEMKRMPDDRDHWERPSSVCGGCAKGSYDLKRIARLEDGHFVSTKHTDDFVAFANSIGKVYVMAPGKRSKASVAPATGGGAPGREEMER
jgi:hypothetical protein